MKIWVRSQDKEDLILISHFDFKKFYQHKETKEFYNEIYSYEESFTEVYAICGMGIYSSKEKAMKVLDMIQEHIANSNKIWASNYVDSGLGKVVYTQDVRVFQMPLDSEVEL